MFPQKIKVQTRPIALQLQTIRVDSAKRILNVWLDAEKYKEEDRLAQEKVQAKNELESYAFQLKQTIEDDKVNYKITPEDKTALISKCDEIVNWLDSNQTAEKEEFEHQKKELEKIANPIMMKIYQTGGMPNNTSESNPQQGPTIEEVD